MPPPGDTQMEPPLKKMPSIEALNSEMPCRKYQKDKGRRMLKGLLNRLRLRRCASVQITEPDPTYRVAYLGNVVTGWAKGEGCVEKPLTTLWKNYTQSSRPDVRMTLTISGGGLRATTKEHGLTEYWTHRLTTCAAPSHFPRLFCWVYRHEGRRLRHELRCHAVLCGSAAQARRIETELRQAMALALAEFRRDKLSRQNARLSLANSVYENPTIPRRKILLSVGGQNYRPPLERSKSAPKLTSIEENIEEEEDVATADTTNVYRRILRHYDSTSALLDKRKVRLLKLEPPVDEDKENETKQDEILDELVRDSHDLLESCERAWYDALKEAALGDGGDESSLSSGCDTISTLTSDTETLQDECCAEKKMTPDIEFRLGGDVNRYKNLVTGAGNEEVSLIPVGEASNNEFSSLKVYKKRVPTNGDDEMDDGNGSDESGYEEEDLASSISSIVLV